MTAGGGEGAAKPLEVFLSAAPADAAHLAEHLVLLVREKAITLWHRGKAEPGRAVDEEIVKHMLVARVFVFLLSANSLADEKCQAQLDDAFWLRSRGGAPVVPILAAACAWQQHGDLADLLVLPRDGSPVGDRAEAWSDIASALGALVSAERSRPLEEPPPPEYSAPQLAAAWRAGWFAADLRWRVAYAAWKRRFPPLTPEERKSRRSTSESSARAPSSRVQSCAQPLAASSLTPVRASFSVSRSQITSQSSAVTSKPCL
jgi:hypothetical protein